MKIITGEYVCQGCNDTKCNKHIKYWLHIGEGIYIEPAGYQKATNWEQNGNTIKIDVKCNNCFKTTSITLEYKGDRYEQIDLR